MIGALLRLARPANILTAISDIIAGMAITGALASLFSDNNVAPLLLIVSTIGLYGGGIVFNDIFDFEDDKINRPERVLPSGKVSLKTAILFGSFLFLTGIVAAFTVSIISGLIAIAITALALSYDKFAKHHAFLGPINMGLCRSGNLLLGMSIIPATIQQFWFTGFVPLAFIGAITLVGQKEAHGNNQSSVLKAILLDILVFLFFPFLMFKGYITTIAVFPFLAFWFGINFAAKTKAFVKNEPKNIMKAVKTGVLSLIPLNAIYVAGFSEWYYALLLICLLPLSIAIAKYYAVT
ncbi:UbiA-like protein EboC [Wenyingzhuangia sp. IMCC45574]